MTAPAPRSRRMAWAGRSRRAVWRRGVARRLAAAGCVGLAAWAAVSAFAPPAPDPGPSVVVASRDLPVGQRLSGDDLTTVHLPTDGVPRGSFAEVDDVSGVLAAPLRQGEVVTDQRLSPAAALAGLADDAVLAHVPLGDAGIAAAVRDGDRVDVLSTVDGAVVAGDVVVTRAAESGLLVAVTPEQASALAVASSPTLPGAGVTVVVRQP